MLAASKREQELWETIKELRATITVQQGDIERLRAGSTTYNRVKVLEDKIAVLQTELKKKEEEFERQLRRMAIPDEQLLF